MRRIGASVLAFAAVFVAVDFMSGQQPGGFGGFGGGFGGPGGGRVDPLTLVRNAQVKKELEITDEQLEKLPAAVMKALGEILTEKQLKRLNQIELQQRGVNAFGDAKVQKSLKFTDEQRDNVTTILEDSRKELATLLKDRKGGGKGKGGFGGGFDKESLEKMQSINKDRDEKLNNVLTAEQKRSWKQMQGDEFKMTFGGFGGFGKKDGKKDEKKDE